MTVAIRVSKKKHKKSLIYTDTDFLLVFVFIEEITRRKEKTIQATVQILGFIKLSNQ